MIDRLKRSWEKNWPELHCAIRAGLPEFVLSGSPPDDHVGIPVFCYHVPDATGFEADLLYLSQNGYTTLTADELLDHLEARSVAPAKSVVLTFDDGAVELYRTAYPLLQAYGHRAVAFIAPYFHDFAPDSFRHERVCTWAELSEMHESGVVDVQSHSFEHRLVTRWPEPAPLCGVINGPSIAPYPSPRAVVEDLGLAKAAIEERLNKTVRHLGWPCYYGTEEAIKAGREVGYEAFWWGVLPGIRDNRPGTDAEEHIVRVSGEFVRRLPGVGRVSLLSVLSARYRGTFARWQGPASAVGSK